MLTPDDFDRLFAGRGASPFAVAAGSPNALPHETEIGMDVVQQQGFALDQQPFGPAYTRWIMSGFYNGDFATGPQSGGTIGSSDKYVLPYWSYTFTGAPHGHTIAWRADSSVASGAVIRMTLSGGGATIGDGTALEQIIPLLSSVTADWDYSIRLFGKCVSITGTPKMRIVYDWLKNDKVTTTGAGATQDTAMVAATTQSNIIAAVTPPVDAAYMRVRFGTYASAGGDACVFDFCDITRVIS